MNDMKVFFKKITARTSTHARGALAHASVQGRPLHTLQTLWRRRALVALLLVVCVFTVEFVLLRLPQAHAAYSISNSLRFNDDDSAYLSRTPGAASNRKTWTMSMWIKRGNLAAAANMHVFGDDSANTYLRFKNDTLEMRTSSGVNSLMTNALFRDPSKWMHLVVAMDTTQAVAANRIKIYIDGVQITSFSAANYPSQNADEAINNNTAQVFGRFSSGDYFDG